MSISGIGMDLVEIKRLSNILKKEHSDAFIKKVFSKEEISYCSKSINKLERYAARFAAKEAFIKATGETSLRLNEISVHKTDHGAPFFILAAPLEKKISDKGIKKIHLSLTHTKKTAGAFVVVET